MKSFVPNLKRQLGAREGAFEAKPKPVAKPPCSGLLSRRAKWPQTVLLTLALLVLPASSRAAPTNALVIEGAYSYENCLLPKAASIETSAQGNFRVTLQGEQWTISYKCLSAQTNASVLYSEVQASCDGGNVYVVHDVNSNATSQAVVMTEANIYPGVCPPPLERDVYNIWTAFVAASAWSEPAGSASPPNASDLSLFYSTRSGCRYAWESDPARGCERKLVIRSQSRVLRRDFKHNGKLRSVALLPPYSDGYPMAEGCWQGITNVGGALLPTRHQFSLFSLDEADGTDTNLYRVSSSMCVITNIHSDRTQFIPAGLEGTTFVMVTDHRFAQQGRAVITYGLTDRWSTAVDDRARRLAAAAPRKSLEEVALEQYGFQEWSGYRALLRFAVRLGLAAFLAVPLFVLVFKRVKQQKYKPKVI